MRQTFLKVLEMSFGASFLVLAVVVARFLLKKAPKWIRLVLWALVAVRLLLPIAPESKASLVPDTSQLTAQAQIALDAPIPLPQDRKPPAVVSPVETAPVEDNISPAITQAPAATVPPATPAATEAPVANQSPSLLTVLAWVWVGGMAVMVIITGISYLRLRHKVATAVRVKPGVYQSENVASPFILGLFRPRIYLPFHMDEQTLPHVLAHEYAHLKRKDHLWKPLGFALLTAHWFNPLMWLGYILLCRDIELACDEKVIKGLDTASRADYSQALLDSSINHRSIAACPLAFGEVGVGQRIKSVLRYKKPAFWLILVALVACIVVAVCFLTNPPQAEPALGGSRKITVPSSSATITEPEQTYPPVTEPEVPLPSVTTPKVTQPFVPEPQLSQPSVTVPEITHPEPPQAPATQPEPDSPSATPPEATQPPVAYDGSPGLEFLSSEGAGGYMVKSIGSCTDSHVRIPDTYNGAPVVGISSQAFLNAPITGISLPATLLFIGESAFSQCKSLAAIQIPNGVTHIGVNAFSDCTSLTSVQLPGSISWIERYTFSGCSSLLHINIPSGVTNICESAFRGCSSLDGIVLPSGLLHLGAKAFYGCRNLTSLEIPSQIHSIGEETFAGCSRLSSIQLPEGCTLIEPSAFSGCSSLHSVHLPSSLLYIQHYAFQNCTSLVNINFPDGLDISWRAFEGCTSLKSVSLPSGAAYIHKGVFQNCTSLTSVSIPSGYTLIGDYAFAGCVNLHSIVLPDTMRHLESYAFSGCTNLHSIELPEGIVHMYGNATSGCTSLSTIEYRGTIAQWEALPFGAPCKVVCSDGEIPLT